MQTFNDSLTMNAFIKKLIEPYVPYCPTIRDPTRSTERPKQITSAVSSVWSPSDKWAWLSNKEFTSTNFLCRMRVGKIRWTQIEVSTVSGCDILHYSVSWLKKDLGFIGFAPEIRLLGSCKYLKSLQGDVVPQLITGTKNSRGCSLLYELPHRSFWIEASPQMPLVLKERCIEALRKIHAQGVVHDNLRLQDLIIGGDGRVTIHGLCHCRALVPDTYNMLKAASAEDFELEMRRLLFLLDYKDARADELQKSRLASEDPTAPGAEESLLRRLTREELREWCTQACAAPSRYVVPGQSAEEVKAAVCSFIALVKGLEAQRISIKPSISTPEPNSFQFNSTTGDSRKRPHAESEDASPNKRPRIHDPQAASTSSNVASDFPTVSSSATFGQAAGSGISRENHPFFRLNEHAVLTDEQKYNLLRHSHIRKLNVAKCEASGLQYVNRFGRVRQGTTGPSYSFGKLKRGREDKEDPLAAEMTRAMIKAQYSVIREHGGAVVYGNPKLLEGPPILTQDDLQRARKVRRPRLPQNSGILRVGGSGPIDADALRAQDNDCADLINDNFPYKSLPLYQTFFRTSSESKKEDKPQGAGEENMSSPRRPESSLSAPHNDKTACGSNQGDTPSSKEIRQ